MSIQEDAPDLTDIQQINGEGKTVLPGLIDAHVHLTIPPNGRDSTAVARHLEKNVPGILREFLEHGITTVRSTGSYWPFGKNLRDRIAGGEFDGPRMITSGPVFTPEGGHPALTVCASVMEGGNPKKVDPYCRSHLAREVKDTKQAREAVSELAEQGVDFIKLASDTVYGPKLMQDEVIEAITDQANKEGLKAVGHVYEAHLMRQALKAGLDGFVHPPFPGIGASIRDDKARELAAHLSKTNTPVTTTQSPWLFFTSQPLDTLLQNGRLKQEDSYLKIFAEEGVPLVVGSDWCPCYPNSNNNPHPLIQAGSITITEMQLLHWGGISRQEIIQAATSNAAKALEMSDEIGTLESGKLADLIIVNGNPLEDLSALEETEIVLQNGEVVAEQ
ncbi:MAG: amidohydrolase family protein [Bacteroidetes bacterium]|nr:amidohydrolase family protein [Bacteroidota bacterium]